MTRHTSMSVAAALGLALAMGAAGAGRAQDASPSGPPPSWDTLVRCAKMADDSASLACFRTAMRASGYGPKPEEVAAERKRVFGLPVPQIKLQRRAAREKGVETGVEAAGPAGSEAAAAASAQALAQTDEDTVTLELSEVALIPPQNKLLLLTTDGAVWAQTDDTTVAHLPKPGQTVEVQRGMMGGYLCKVDKWTKVRCARRR